MVDWTSAGVVALTGIISVFLVLGILNVAVAITGTVSQKIAAREKARSIS